MSDKPLDLREITINRAEMIVRVIEACTGVKRPVADAHEVLERTDDEMIQSAWRAALAANGYLMECLRAGGAVIELEAMPPHPDLH